MPNFASIGRVDLVYRYRYNQVSTCRREKNQEDFFMNDFQ